jgi:hypothetical protein
MDVGLGLAEPSFQAIVRALRILLSNSAMANFDPSSNGLGLNNILYVSTLIEYFLKRLDQKKSDKSFSSKSPKPICTLSRRSRYSRPSAHGSGDDVPVGLLSIT